MNPLLLIGLAVGGIYLLTRKSDGVDKANAILDAPVDPTKSPYTNTQKAAEALWPDPVQRKTVSHAMDQVLRMVSLYKHDNPTATPEQINAVGHSGIDKLVSNGVITASQAPVVERIFISTGWST